MRLLFFTEWSLVRLQKYGYGRMNVLFEPNASARQVLTYTYVSDDNVEDHFTIIKNASA